MREERERAAVGLPAGPEFLRGDEQGRHQRARDQKRAHDQRRRQQQAVGGADFPLGFARVVLLLALDERHHGDAGLEARETQRQLREKQQRDHDHLPYAAVLGEQEVLPVNDDVRLRGDVRDADPDDDQVEREVDHDQGHGDADRLP